MKNGIFISRFLSQRLPSSRERRLALITGARQTGKTTLALQTYPELNYITLDEVEERMRIRDLPTRAWAQTVGRAILDEAQKEPSLFEKVKFAFDRGEIDFTVLLGSSQILMLKRVRETLAGRVFVYELWPLLLAEMMAKDALSVPLFDLLLTEPGRADDILARQPAVLMGDAAFESARWLDYALKWGGMPALLTLSEPERRDWLRSYALTYLERDLSDLARLYDVAPFRRFQRLAALRSGQLLSYAGLARDADVSPGTAKNYIRYLELSYQTFLLPPFFGNLTKRLVKSPKLYWIDVGLWREQTGMWGEMSGALLETFVISECYKWVKTMRPSVDLTFYRTHSGAEVDLVVGVEDGVWGIEVKTGRKIGRGQTRSLRELAAQLGERWRGGIVVHPGEMIQPIAANIWAVPVHRLLGPVAV